MEAPRNIRRSVKIRTESPQETLTSNQEISMNPSLREILLQICNPDALSASTKPHAASLLNLVAKQLEGKDPNSLGIDSIDLFTCLKIPLINDNKVVRAAGLRVLRLCIHNEESVRILIKTKLHHFIAKCLDVTLDNIAERAQALRLCRKLLLVAPDLFQVALGRSIVALAIDGSKEKDRLVRASFALLAELCVLNPSIFIASGGVRCFSSSILDCPSPRMQEAMIASLLYLLNTESRRKVSGLNLHFLIAPYSDFHYKHNIDVGDPNTNATVSHEDRELRLICAKQALLSVLRSWPGLLHVISCNIFQNLVQVLLPCHLETRKAMLDFFYTLLRLPLPEWTDELTVALQATDPSRIQDAWKLQEGYVAMEGKALLPHVSKFRPNLVLNHTALLVYCLVECGLVQTLIQVIVTSDTFISVRATLLLGELLHLSSTLLPPVCHGTKMCLPSLVDCITSLKSDPLKRHRAAQAAAALTRIHHLKKQGVVPHSLALKQIIQLEKRDYQGQSVPSQDRTASEGHELTEMNGYRVDDGATYSVPKMNTMPDGDPLSRSGRDLDATLSTLVRECGVLAQKDPLLWNWHVLSNVFLWAKVNGGGADDSSLRSIIRRLVQFFKPSSNQFVQCEFNNQRTRLYSVVGTMLVDFLTSVQEAEYDRMLSEFLEDLSSAIRNISSATSAHDCLLSPGRLSTTACQDYFLFIGRLSGSVNGTAALERAGIFQDLLELVKATNHDCYLKVVVSHLNYHADGFARAILKKVMNESMESGRIYATHHLRVLLRAAVVENNSANFAKWAVPLLLNQFKDNCRVVVTAAADILDEATDDTACIETLILLQPQFTQLIQQQEEQHLGLRGRLLLIKTLSIPSGFKLWNQTIGNADPNDPFASTTLIQKELEQWLEHFNVRYVQMVESDLADGLTHHQRSDDGRYGRLSNARHVIRELPVPPHLFSQLNRHREGLDFLRMSGHLSRIFTRVTSGSWDTEQEILELKAATWAAGHLATSEAGVNLLESALVVDGFIRMATESPVLALRGTAYFALNLVATTSAGVDLLSRFGWASIKRHHGELWHVVDDSEWICLPPQTATGASDGNVPGARERVRTTSQSSSYSVTFARDLGAAHSVKGLVTSTPVRGGVNVVPPSTSGAGPASWDVESQPYSFEGSSIHFDSDSEFDVEVDMGADIPSRIPEAGTDQIPDAVGATDRCRRAFTLPPTIHPGSTDHVAHFRSFSDSHYAPPEELAADPATNGRRPSMETRIWNRLRSSLRLRKSKRFSLPGRSSSKKESIPPVSASLSPVQMVHYGASSGAPEAVAETKLSATEDDEESSSDLETLSPPPPPFRRKPESELPVCRLGSVSSQSAPSKKRAGYRHSYNKSSASTWAPSFIGLSLPVQLSTFYPRKELFYQELDRSWQLDSVTISHDVPNEQFDHETDHCLLCSADDNGFNRSNDADQSQLDEERLLVRKELLRLVFNMGSSVGLNANEQGLLRLKQRFPRAFHDVCLFSDVCHVLATYGYRLRARRFLHELFMDSPFVELYAEAAKRLQSRATSIDAESTTAETDE